MPGIGEGASFPSVARHGHRAVFLQQVLDSNLYRAELSNENGPAVRQLAASTRMDTSPDIAPDGSRIAFASNRTGSFEIWLMDADGGHPRQLSDLGNHAHRPRWSPDGRRIVFMARPSTTDLASLYVVDVSTGATNRITSGPSTINSRPGRPTAQHLFPFGQERNRGRFGRRQRLAASPCRSHETAASRPGNRATGSSLLFE